MKWKNNIVFFVLMVFLVAGLGTAATVISNTLITADEIQTSNFTVSDNFTLNANLSFSDHHTVSLGNPTYDSIAASAWSFHDEQMDAEGSVEFIITQENKTIIALQVGRNNSAGLLGNSLMVMPNNLTQDMGMELTNSTDCLKVYDFFSISQRLDCDTGGYGASVLIQGGLHVWREMFVEQAAFFFGSFNFVGDGNDFEIFNASIHTRTPRTEEVNLPAGDGVTSFEEAFTDVDISPFVKINQQGPDTNNWLATTSAAFCQADACARAEGGTGGALRIMTTNVTLDEFTNLNLLFYYGSNNMDAGSADNFSIWVNNNTGSDYVLLWNDTTTNADISPPTLIDLALPSNMWNSTMELRFEHQATAVNEESYVDTISINGTLAGASALNVTRFDSSILLGPQDESELLYNDSSNRLHIGNQDNPTNLTMYSPDGSDWNCGVNNAGTFSCS